MRALVQDTHPVIRTYSDSALDSQIRFSLLQHDWSEKPDTLEVLEISKHDTLIVSLEIAIRLLSGRPDDFSYRNPVLSVNRRGTTNKLLGHLEDLLAELQGGRFALSVETDITAFLKSIDRYWNEFNSAYNISASSVNPE